MRGIIIAADGHDGVDNVRRALSLLVATDVRRVLIIVPVTAAVMLQDALGDGASDRDGIQLAFALVTDTVTYSTTDALTTGAEFVGDQSVCVVRANAIDETALQRALKIFKTATVTQ